MEKDRIFARYAFCLVGLFAIILTFAVSAGIAELPELGFFVEHAGLGVLFRGTFKSFGGSHWIREALERSGMITAEGAAPSGAAGAMS